MVANKYSRVLILAGIRTLEYLVAKVFPKYLTELF